MNELHFSILISAPKEKVWNTMINRDSYQAWAEAFVPGSHYVGDWHEGSKVLFLAPDMEGKMLGTVSRIKEFRPYEYISIEHIGIWENGREDISSQSVIPWAGAQENYTFKEVGKKTELSVDLNKVEEYKEMFIDPLTQATYLEDTWPKALHKIKELAEK